MSGASLSANPVTARAKWTRVTRRGVMAGNAKGSSTEMGNGMGLQSCRRSEAGLRCGIDVAVHYDVFVKLEAVNGVVETFGKVPIRRRVNGRVQLIAVDVTQLVETLLLAGNGRDGIPGRQYVDRVFGTENPD